MTALERTPNGSLDPAIASAKFLPPPLPRHWVRRDRLACQLSASVQHRLTVVTGPPGAGKTVLLADWAHGAAGQVAWLTVEEVDNDPERFWRHLAAALDLDHPRGRVEIDNGIAPADDPYLALLARYASATTPRILIVDDFHLITDTSIIAGVASLVEHLPAQLRLVVAGQRAPGFPLQRLQSAGEATTIGDDDLRFTVEESAALITLAAGVFIPLEEITTLNERSEGWAAGLYLAAVALSQLDDSSEFVRQYSGTFSPVAEYLELEMLLRQPPDLIRFLLQTSVLDHLSPDLCRAVTGRGDAGRILEHLSDHHLFVMRTGPEEGGFRFHRLFADLLRFRLRLEDPLLTRQAHFSAATWFERRHDVRSAAHHFSQAHAYERACMLLFARPGQPLDGGLPAETAIPASGPQSGTTTEEDPGHLYVLAAVQLGSLRVADAARLLRRLAATVAEQPDRSLWQGRVEFLWAIHAERLADPPAVLDHCRTATDLMASCTPPTTGASSPHALAGSWLETMDATICTRLPVLAARAHAWLGDSDQAEACLVDHFGDRTQAEVGQPAIFARIAGGRGRLKEAYRLATVAIEETESTDGGNELVGLDARLVLADVLFEHNELEAARDQLDTALHLCQSSEVSHWIWAVEIDLVRLLIAQQRPGEALSRIGHLRRIEGRTPPPHHLLQKLNRVEITCRLALGDVEGCFLIGRSMAGGDMSQETSARLDLCAGRPDRALTRLAVGPIPTTAAEIRRLVLLACAELQLGRTRRAHDTLRRAVETGRADLYVRPFLDDPAQTVLLLRGMVSTRPDPYLMHLISEAGRLAPAATPVVSTSAMLEPLTEREREVLGFLPSHLNQHQIAMVMYVSLNTVKSHLKAIYRKIGAARATRRSPSPAATDCCRPARSPFLWRDHRPLREPVSRPGATGRRSRWRRRGRDPHQPRQPPGCDRRGFCRCSSRIRRFPI